MKKIVKTLISGLCLASMTATLVGCTSCAPEMQKVELPEIFGGTYQTVNEADVKDFVERLEGGSTAQAMSQKAKIKGKLEKEILSNNIGLMKKADMQATANMSIISLGYLQNGSETKIKKEGLAEDSAYKAEYREKGKASGMINTVKDKLPEDVKEMLDFKVNEYVMYDDGQYVYTNDGAGGKTKTANVGAFEFLTQGFDIATWLGGAIEHVTLADAVVATNLEYKITAWQMDESSGSYIKVKAIVKDTIEMNGIVADVEGAQTWIYSKELKCVGYSLEASANGTLSVEGVGNVAIKFSYVDYMMPWTGTVTAPADLSSYVAK